MKKLSDLAIAPALFNSPCPWASDETHLRTLYDCPFTGAVTTRSTMRTPYPHDPAIHQFTLFDPATTAYATPNQIEMLDQEKQNASLNTIVFSPYNLDDYLGFIRNIIGDQPQRKPFIISITGTKEDVAQMYVQINQFAQSTGFRLAVEVNLSCPNVAEKALPAYDESALVQYLCTLKQAIIELKNTDQFMAIPLGVKVPPYTYFGQFQQLIRALKQAKTALNADFLPITFITTMNTLGSSLVLDERIQAPALMSADGTGIGGMAGVPIHALALGNVATLRRLLNEDRALTELEIIGVGGVCDKAGLERMQHVGADFVALATALGRYGVDVFERIVK